MIVELLVIWVVAVVAFFVLWVVLAKVVQKISQKKHQNENTRGENAQNPTHSGEI